MSGRSRLAADAGAVLAAVACVVGLMALVYLMHHRELRPSCARIAGAFDLAGACAVAPRSRIGN